MAEIKKATRVGIRPLVVFYAESGCGKTYTALLVARGMAGKDGKVVMIDSESGRGSLYADVTELGGYDVMELTSFSPSDYIAAIDAVEASGAAIGIIDSGSHEWEGIGGVLDQAGEAENKSGRAGLHNWRMPKMEHQKFIQRLLRAKIPWIVCLRAKYKTRQTKGTEEMVRDGVINQNQIGKTIILKDFTTSPIQAEDFIFEATCHAEILPNHSIILTKHSHPALKGCFPEDKKEPMRIEHGEKIAKWCLAGGTVAANGSDTADLKAKLWAALKPVRGPEKNWNKAEEWMTFKKIIQPGESVANFTAEQFRVATDKTQIELTQQ